MPAQGFYKSFCIHIPRLLLCSWTGDRITSIIAFAIALFILQTVSAGESKTYVADERSDYATLYYLSKRLPIALFTL